MRSSRSLKKNKLIIICLLAASVVAVGAYALSKSNFIKRDSQSKTSGSSKTYQASSEGSTFEVPGDVPKESIKNYTLITENEEFKIRRDGNTDDYLITLYAIINRPDQYDMYKDQLREYKRHALEYLEGQGIDISKIDITYEPAEATQL